jgi:hypothetical protein
MNDCQNRLFRLVYSQEWHLDRLFAEYSKQIGFLFQNYSGRMVDFKEKELNRILLNFNIDMERLIKKQIENSFSISDNCNDLTIKEYLKGVDINENQIEKMLVKNPNAAAAFTNRAATGFNLSDRVWKLTNQTRESLNLILESGVLNGRSAGEMARDLKQYLKQPDRQFRRLLNADGKLILSNPAKNYHPGQGVYRSSYQNALRLSRNEVNLAYRTNDFERRKEMPFVMGQEVNLSGSHPTRDICDHLAGTYPKEFKFTGWHVSCFCNSTSILLPRDKFKEYLKGGEIDKRHTIKRIPNKAFNFLNENSETIKGWKSQPYFITDNFKNTKKGFILNF